MNIPEGYKERINENGKKEIVPTKEKLRIIKQSIEEEIKNQRDWRDMRILWHSVAPWVTTGYGVVSKYFLSGLMNRGFVLFASAFYGLQSPGHINWNGINVLPNEILPNDSLGFNSVREHYKRFQCELGIFMSDFWVSSSFTKVVDNSLIYTPIDMENYPDKWLDILKQYKWRAIPSQHGVNELKKNGIESVYVPHGVNTKVYRPLDKKICRQSFSIEEDKFIIGIVAGNKDREPRKAWDTNFLAIKKFFEQNKDAEKDTIVMIHTNPIDNRGRNLVELAKQIGIEKNIIWNDRYLTNVFGTPEESMARFYNLFDTFLLLSRREGFCIPVLEAQACGVPCILNKFSAMIERNDNGRCGWLCKPATMTYTPINSMTSIPDADEGADALEEAYNKPNTRDMYAKRSLEYARRQTWDIALDKHFIPLLEQIGEEVPSLTKHKEAKVIESNA